MTDETTLPALPPRIGMPRDLVDAIAEIKTKIEPASQTGEITEGEGEARHSRSYATPDDIFGALQRLMGERGMVCDMIIMERSINDVAGGVLIQMELAPRWYMGDIVYTCEDSALFMAAWLEGMNTAAAMRTLAEKTYLRNLFKIPTVKAGGAADSLDGHARPISPPSAAESVESPSGIKPLSSRRKSPLQLGKDESNALRSEMIAEINHASENAAGKQEALAAIDDAFKRRQEDYPRLQQKDAQIIRAHMAMLTGTINGRAA